VVSGLEDTLAEECIFDGKYIERDNNCQSLFQATDDSRLDALTIMARIFATVCIALGADCI
jgi:hypothetical protein